MTYVASLCFRDARARVVETVRAARKPPASEEVALLEGANRVLAEDILADRDYPPVDRSIRDGFAVRSADLPGDLEIIGEVRAGGTFAAEVGPGQAVEIMTGAPVPRGADAVVMVEHVRQEKARVVIDQAPEPGQFINPKGGEARLGQCVLQAGRRLGFAGIALAATVGRATLPVYRKPKVAILPTGDEIVPVEAQPLDSQVRNSNAHSLAVQVLRAGGRPELLPPAKDDLDATRELVTRGLQSDLLLLSGGVSAGKYDLVETVLAGLGAEFYFDRVFIQPGQPLVFGRAHGTFFFGLPGNPASTMVTFEIFAKAALELLGGQSDVLLPILQVRLACDFRHKPGLTRFLPARLSSDGCELTPIPWHGSSDVPAMAKANSLLVAEADREFYRAGDLIGVLVT
jgi:molybdopterin molybdotransferase